MHNKGMSQLTFFDALRLLWAHSTFLSPWAVSGLLTVARHGLVSRGRDLTQIITDATAKAVFDDLAATTKVGNLLFLPLSPDCCHH